MPRPTAAQAAVISPEFVKMLFAIDDLGTSRIELFRSLLNETLEIPDLKTATTTQICRAVDLYETWIKNTASDANLFNPDASRDIANRIIKVVYYTNAGLGHLLVQEPLVSLGISADEVAHVFPLARRCYVELESRYSDAVAEATQVQPEALRNMAQEISANLLSQHASPSFRQKIIASMHRNILKIIPIESIVETLDRRAERKQISDLINPFKVYVVRQLADTTVKHT